MCVFVPDISVPMKLYEFNYRGEDFRSASEAAEKAAETLIRKLEKKYDF